jgi:xanthine dehydrogenase accessory factor
VVVFGAGHVAAALARVLQPLPWRLIAVDSRAEWADPSRFAPSAEVICAEPLRLIAAWGWLGAAAQQSQAAQRLVEELRQLSARGLPEAPDPATTSTLVMTHDHALDRDLVEALLRLGERRAGSQAELAYVGLIGSRSKIAATRSRLLQRGTREEQIARLVAPIGLQVDGALLGGNLPGEIAISVAAQLLSLRRPRPAAPDRSGDS